MEYFDQLNREIIIKQTPQRIVSLVPSITYTLSDFDLNENVVGITRFCKFLPYSKKEKTIIGGTKDIKIDRIKSLKPDIILANKEENTKEIVEQLEKIAPVFVSDIKNFDDNIDFLERMGKIFNNEIFAIYFVRQLNKLKKTLETEKEHLKKTIYLIWKNPWMTIGGDTYIHDMMKLSGFDNLYKQKKRYPTTDIEEMKKLNPEVILLSSEPYPFKAKHQQELQEIFPETKILLVQGEAFTWFGTYQIKGLEYLSSLIKNQ